MNGQQQQQRRTAVIDLDYRITTLAEAFDAELTKDKTELTTLIGETRDLFAKMLNDETEFRKAAIRNDVAQIKGYIDRQLAEMSGSALYFLKLPWYRRWAWCLFGAQTLLWGKRKQEDDPINHAYAATTRGTGEQTFIGQKPQ